ncbi:MAG: hypothetical protein ACKPKO_53850, partial [Candidatus Fonsibacter sp.]
MLIYHLKADKSTTYTKSEVETIASTRQATITTDMSFDANNASFAGKMSTRVWTSPTTWVEKCIFESTGNSDISGTMNVIGNISSSTGNISTTSGNMSAGSISTTGNISAGSVSTTTGNITTTSGNISSTSGNIQTISGTITGKNGSFQN